jgi:2-hydroxychromene-2-carboxylate isomerase
VSLAADIEEARLSVLLDLRHPLAYLALHPAVAFGRSLGLEINWLPLAVPTLRPPSQPGPEDDRGILHRRHRARAIAREIGTYAAAQGLVLKDYYRDGDAAAANLGWLWLRDRHPERLVDYLAELFRAYWSLELDSSSPEQVSALVDSLTGDGADFQVWSTREGPDAAAALAGELRERGLSAAPAFVVEDEVFQGRQHLPMIRWILEGRAGPVPI